MVTIHRKFVTVIPANNMNVDNEYVRGWLNAIFNVFCNTDLCLSQKRLADGCWSIVVRTTENMYALAKSYIEDRYPGMCEFDVTRGFSEEA